MTVLQEDPFATFQRLMDNLFCYWPLALAQWDGLNSERQWEIEIPLWPCVNHCICWTSYQTPPFSLYPDMLPWLATSHFSRLLTVACRHSTLFCHTTPTLCQLTYLSVLLLEVVLPVKTTSLFCKALKGPHRIRSCAENEDQRRGGAHIAVEVRQVNWRVFHKLLPQADNHKLCCCKHNLHKRGKQ